MPTTIATASVRTLNATALLLGGSPYQREDLAGYLAAGGYRLGPADLLARVSATGLRGRGGAGFPLATKLAAVAGATGRPVVVANGEEGEPGSVKDRHLMRMRPHLILDGLVRAATIVGAQRGYVYVSDPHSAASMRDALTEREQPIRIGVVEVAPAYVAGEETAVARFIDGGPALPVAKPPRPFERGVGGAPTLISNVETLAHIALLAAGIDASEHLLVTVSGRDIEPVLLETHTSSTCADLLAAAGCADATGALVGGMFGGFRPLDELGATPGGIGVVHALRPGDCPVDVAADALAYLAVESSRQCGVCVSGTRSLADAVAGLRAGTATATHVANIARWATGLPGRGACGLLDAAARIAGTLGQHFATLAIEHTNRPCEPCARSPLSGGARFVVAPTQGATLALTQGATLAPPHGPIRRTG